MKGIILAGGSGTRLYPITKGVSKQLLPVYDKPMIYYPLSVLMLAGLRDILIITTPQDENSFRSLLGDGTDIGVKISYVVQPSPDGLAQAFLLAEDFLAGDDACLILGDNIFYGHGLAPLLLKSVENAKANRASIFGYRVSDPERYGVAEFDANQKVISIVEKPQKPRSNYAVVGLYFYPADVVEKAKTLLPSARGELEITDLNQLYLEQDRLDIELLGRGFAWLDTGLCESLMQASSFIQSIQARQGLKVACIEEIAYKEGFIDKDKLIELGKSLSKNEYGKYLLEIASEGGGGAYREAN